MSPLEQILRPGWLHSSQYSKTVGGTVKQNEVFYVERVYGVCRGKSALSFTRILCAMHTPSSVTGCYHSFNWHRTSPQHNSSQQPPPSSNTTTGKRGLGQWPKPTVTFQKTSPELAFPGLPEQKKNRNHFNLILSQRYLPKPFPGPALHT